MKKIFLGILLVLLTLSTQAQEKKNKNAKAIIEVNGNCEQCQTRIQKAAYSVKGVKIANWNVETHQLVVFLNEEKTSVIEIEKAIAKVGHDTGHIRTSEELYENLHYCCKYERLEPKNNDFKK